MITSLTEMNRECYMQSVKEKPALPVEVVETMEDFLEDFKDEFK